MKNIVDFDVTFRRPDVIQAEVSRSNPEELRLDSIRGLSNIIQALENAVAQYHSRDEFKEAQVAIERYLFDARRRLRELIHTID